VSDGLPASALRLVRIGCNGIGPMAVSPRQLCRGSVTWPHAGAKAGIKKGGGEAAPS
jgi:hypothetical protein